VCDEQRILEVLALEHVDDVGDVRVEIDLGVQEVCSIAESS
jgi:hypothetical protein